ISLDFFLAQGCHRLYRDRVARGKQHAAAFAAVIWDFWRHVHFLPYAMAYQLAHDSQARVAQYFFYRRANITDAHRPFYRVDSRVQAALGGVYQVLFDAAWLFAHYHGKSRVGLHAFVRNDKVETNDVALLQLVFGGDSVHDLF